MLTIAVVVTAAVVLTSAPAAPIVPAESAYQYPVQELSAEHKAYLDEVWAAMEASDLDALDLLAKDDMIRAIGYLSKKYWISWCPVIMKADPMVSFIMARY